MPNKCPILLFAFANDDGRSLRQLDEEQKALRKIFLQAEKEGACEVRILVAATEQDVAEAFQEYWGRVRIFHYGGHSNEKELFFRSNNKQSVEASSLADFLALQEGLELVFLNSCLSLGQAEACQKSGIKRIIATSREIGDFAAREFARRFYESLATGAELRQSFWEAERGFQHDYEDQYRAVTFEAEKSEDQFPWRLVPANATGWSIQALADQLPERSPVRGLLPFEPKDAVLFHSLQRNEDIARIHQALIRQDFSVGLLTGESGCGKTSFLQAGLQPALESAGYRVVYIKCSDAPPMESLRQAMKKATRRFISEHTEFLPFVEQINATAHGQPWVLLFDQFEQFFIHHPTEADRAPFLEGLNNWYQQRSQFPVKLLFSVRKDTLYLTYGLQGKLGFSLTPAQTYFQLHKFTPLQAAEIFRVMAELKNIGFDEGFVMELCEKELASRKDRLISAVDIQILAMMLGGQQASSDRAFTRRAYERLGGIEGLLQRYVKEQLNTPTIHNKDQNALKVLLSMVDLDQNVRAGLLTQAHLQHKLNGLVLAERLPEILEWLCSVRLVSKIAEEDKPFAYELAHERLVIPLRNLAGKMLSRVARISHTLDRRVNEWLGNGQAARYLFNLNELWAVRKYRQLISWEPRREQKEALIRTSWSWWNIRLGLLSVLSLSLIALWIFLQTPSGIEKRILYWDFPNSLKAADPATKMELAPLLIELYPVLAKNVVRNITDPEQFQAALMLICDSLWRDSSLQLTQIEALYGLDYSLMDSIGDPANTGWPQPGSQQFNESKASIEATVALIKAIGEIREKEKAAAFLKTAQTLLQQFEGTEGRTRVMNILARVAGQIEKEGQLLTFSILAQAIAKQFEGTEYHAKVLVALAMAADNLGEKENMQAFLKIAQGFEDVEYYALGQIDMAKAAGKAGEKEKLIAFLERAQTIARYIDEMTIVLYFLGGIPFGPSLTEDIQEMEGTDTEAIFLEKVQVVAMQLDTPEYRALAMFILAGVAMEIGEKEMMAAFLQKARAIAWSIEDIEGRAFLVAFMASIASEEGDIAFQKVITFSEMALILVRDTISTEYYERGRPGSGEVVGKVQEIEKIVAALNLGRVVAQDIEDVEIREIIPIVLAKAATEIGEKEKAVDFFEMAQVHAPQLEYINHRAEVLVRSADETGEKGKAIAFLEEARTSILQIDKISSRVESLITLARAAREIGEVERAITFLEEAQTSILQIDNISSRVESLITLVRVAREIGEVERAITFLEEARTSILQKDNISSRVESLITLVRVAGEIGEAEKAFAFLEAAQANARQFKGAEDHSKGLVELVKATGDLTMTTKDTAYLYRGLAIAREIEYSGYYFEAMMSLIKSSTELAKITENTFYFGLAYSIAQQIERAEDRAKVLIDLAESSGKMGEKNRPMDFLSQSLAIAQNLEDAEARTELMISLAGAAAELAKSTEEKAYLDRGLSMAQYIEDAGSRAEVMRNLARSAWEMKLWKKGYRCVRSMPPEYQALGYAWILRFRQRH